MIQTAGSEKLISRSATDLLGINSFNTREIIKSANNEEARKNLCVDHIGFAIDYLLKLKYHPDNERSDIHSYLFFEHIFIVTSYTKELSKKDNEEFLKYLEDNIQSSYLIGIGWYKTSVLKCSYTDCIIKNLPEECVWTLDELINHDVCVEKLLDKLPDME